MKLFLITIFLSFNAQAALKEDCRHYYLELIKNNQEIKVEKGNDQLNFYLNPKMFQSKYKTLEHDSKLKECISY